jgi:uncharacterized membrane protein (DUF4010 family)
MPAGVTAVAALHAQGRIGAAGAGAAVLMAVGANGITRTAVAWTTGGRRYALWVALGLLPALAAAAAMVAWAAPV